jgi:hypothetical protein
VPRCTLPSHGAAGYNGFMIEKPADLLTFRRQPKVQDTTLVLAFSGWMDGGDVSTGTVERLVNLLEATPIAEIDPDPFYIYNFPGSMEIAAIFRPHIAIEDGVVKSMEVPTNTFYCHDSANVALFVGKEPNLRWRSFRDCILSGFCLSVRLVVRYPIRASRDCTSPVRIRSSCPRWNRSDSAAPVTRVPVRSLRT